MAGSAGSGQDPAAEAIAGVLSTDDESDRGGLAGVGRERFAPARVTGSARLRASDAASVDKRFREHARVRRA